eukprot:gene13197-12976_t
MPTHFAYTQRFNAVLAYIDANLEGDLSVKTLSGVANFSAFHFHRQFTAFVGVPVSRYVQLMRLRRAAHRLAAVADHSVLDAALDAGFESPEAFCRAFKRAIGMTPSAFSKEPNWQVWNTVESVRKFIEWRMHSGQSPQASSRTFGIPYNNPDTTPPQAFRFAICGEIHEAVAPNEFGVHALVIPGGRCVVVRHTGSPDHIGETIYPIYRDWLPTSGEELRDQPLFFNYLSAYPQTPMDQWQTDIYVPLQ